MNQTNEDLIIANTKEDLSCFEDLYQIYLKKVYRYFAVRTLNQNIAEDLTSETFLRALENFEKYESKGRPFGAWLFRIAHNLLVDFYRKNEQKTENIEDTYDIASDENITEDTHFKFVVEKISELLDNFSSDEKEILTLKLTSGLKFSEIAQIIGKSENTIKSKYFRNLKILKNNVAKFAVLLFFITP